LCCPPCPQMKRIPLITITPTKKVQILRVMACWKSLWISHPPKKFQKIQLQIRIIVVCPKSLNSIYNLLEINGIFHCIYSIFKCILSIFRCISMYFNAFESIWIYLNVLEWIYSIFENLYSLFECIWIYLNIFQCIFNVFQCI
jgi:hypothetical protein